MTRNNEKLLDTFGETKKKKKNDAGHRIDSCCNERIKVSALRYLEIFQPIYIEFVWFIFPLVDLSSRKEGGCFVNGSIKVKSRKIDERVS